MHHTALSSVQFQIGSAPSQCTPHFPQCFTYIHNVPIAMFCFHCMALIPISPNCISAALQVTEHLAARSAQFREAAVHYQLGLMAKAIHAWYIWLGRHLSNATTRQEHLLTAQVRLVVNAKLLSMKAATEITAHMSSTKP